VNRKANLTADPVPSLIRHLAVPVSVGFFFNTMFNVVDTFYAGLISTQALAALSLSFPVFFIIIALAGGVSTGTTALIATSLGAGDERTARTMAVQGVVFGLLLSVLVTTLGLTVSPTLFSLLGASGQYLETSVAYMDTIFAGAVFFVLNNMLNAVLNAQGDTRPFRNFLIMSFFLNCLLDPWFMFGWLGFPALGVRGVALATVVCQAAGCVYLGSCVARTDLMCRDCFREIVPDPRAIGEIVKQGLPTGLNFITVGLGAFVITYFISAFGAQAVAAYGVALRVEQIMLLPSIGLNVATVTLVAQNNGARMFARVFETVRAALAYGGVFMAAAGVVLFMLAGPLMQIFTKDAAVVEIGVLYLRIAAFLLYAYVVLYVNVAALQGVKRPGYGLFIGLLRQIALPLVVFPLFLKTLGFGLAGIWWGIFCINWCAAAFTYGYTRFVLRRLLVRGQA
jgi:putative MATE family efflux protein